MHCCIHRWTDQRALAGSSMSLGKGVMSLKGMGGTLAIPHSSSTLLTLPPCNHNVVRSSSPRVPPNPNTLPHHRPTVMALSDHQQKLLKLYIKIILSSLKLSVFGILSQLPSNILPELTCKDFWRRLLYFSSISWFSKAKEFYRFFDVT